MSAQHPYVQYICMFGLCQKHGHEYLMLGPKAVNREDILSRRYRDRDLAKFESSRRYRER